MASVAGALVLNIGTLSKPWIDAMLLAGKAANRAGAPVVLDPGRRRGDEASHRDGSADSRRGGDRSRPRQSGRGRDARRPPGGDPGRRVDRRGRLGSRAGEGSRGGARLRRRRHRPGRPRLGRRAGDRRRERPRAARHRERDGMHVDRDHRLLPGCAAPIGRSRLLPRLSSPSVSPERTPRGEAKGPGTFHVEPLRRALQPRPGDARLEGEARAMKLHAVVSDLETAKAAVEGGATVIQLRLKDASTEQVVAVGGRLPRPRLPPSSSTTTCRLRSRSVRTACISVDDDSGAEAALAAGLMLGTSASSVEEARGG